MGVGKGLDVAGKEVESNKLDALERSADNIYIYIYTNTYIYTYDST